MNFSVSEKGVAFLPLSFMPMKVPPFCYYYFTIVSNKMGAIHNRDVSAYHRPIEATEALDFSRWRIDFCRFRS